MADIGDLGKSKALDPVKGGEKIGPAAGKPLAPPTEKVKPEKTFDIQKQPQEGNKTAETEKVKTPMDLGDQKRGQAIVSNKEGYIKTANETEKKINTQTKEFEKLINAKDEKGKFVLDRANKVSGFPATQITRRTNLFQHLEKFDDAIKFSTKEAVGAHFPTKTTATDTVKKCLHYLVNGQKNMQEAQKLAQSSDSAMDVSTAFKTQLKMQTAQREIEFFANFLNKCIEFVKTTMNIQL